ncbi:hypothetical protein CDAR_369391 [Caerostris darwini]|uniref:Uncharacterized protein n=1 Tax=Caerostris darwini TaxID=1538125 RepID=A0AAV4RUZ2_9ARAC|nr:hypothetical protein CDAR_369391 [Caerostris darwini]
MRHYVSSVEDGRRGLSSAKPAQKKMERTIPNWRQDGQRSPRSGRRRLHQFPSTLRTLYSFFTEKWMFLSDSSQPYPLVGGA